MKPAGAGLPGAPGLAELLGAAEACAAGCVSAGMAASGSPEIVLFDLDGVLVDSQRAIHHSVQAAVDDAGLGWTLDYQEDVRPIIGPPMGQGLRDLLLRRGGDPELMPEFVRAYRRHYAEVALSDSSLYEGIPEALDELRSSRHCSSRRRSPNVSRTCCSRALASATHSPP